MNEPLLSGAAPLSRRAFSRLFTVAGLAALASAARTAAARQTRPTVGLAIGTYGMKNLPTPDALRLITETGYDGVQLAIMAGWATDPARLTANDRRVLRRQIEDSGLAVPALLESIPLRATADARAKNLDRLKRAVELGNDLVPGRPPYLDTILGQKKAEWEKVREAMADDLRTWVPILEDGKTTLTFKPHAGDAVQSVERVLWLINAVGSPRIRIVFDYSHFFVEGYPLEECLRQLIAYAPLIVVKDSEGTSEKHAYLLPGDGKTDYLAYFRLLRELGYSGFVNVEVSAHVHRHPGYQAVSATKVCYERLAPLMDRAGLVRPERHRKGRS
ncbi:MAG: sugar phosphate isomerase/epimerase [Verrucomicrobia bacterium]|nr:sugar phosphate isomerase/epimerase [Verrucomicrobiota bacterium]